MCVCEVMHKTNNIVFKEIMVTILTHVIYIIHNNSYMLIDVSSLLVSNHERHNY